jgi:hypothetical protein
MSHHTWAVMCGPGRKLLAGCKVVCKAEGVLLSHPESTASEVDIDRDTQLAALHTSPTEN